MALKQMFTRLSFVRSAMPGIVVLAALALRTPQAYAGFIVDVQQDGDDVVITGSGTINTSALGFGGSVFVNPQVFPYGAGVSFYPGPVGVVDAFTGFTGPLTFGSGDFFASSYSGSAAGIIGGVSELFVPTGYSGASPSFVSSIPSR